MSGQQLEGRILKRANPKTIQDKFLVGYQGWFTCNGDGEPLDPNHHGWIHWFDKPIPDGGRPNTDLWPDVSEYSPSELYPAPGLKNADGEQMFLFSSRHPKTVTRHFHWMALHGVDGAFLQRFAGQLGAGSAMMKIRDEVGDRVREAAEAEGRVFAIMYDVSGVDPNKIQQVLEEDWTHLMRDKCILDSPNYLREKGSPVIALWGFGFNGRNHSPDVVRSITNFFRSSTPGGAYLMAGVPGHWRTSISDSDPDPEFLRVWTEEFDALSPWTIGRYGNEEDAERWGNEKVKPDFDFLKQRADEGKKKVDYIPVVLPGGSGYNLSHGQWGFNAIKRNGGHFLWKQIYAARRAGVRIIYGAMWDEYDEGTAYMPVVSSSKQLPVHPQFDFLALDADGHSLPSDWYMRIVGFAAEILRGDRVLHETFPIKELQDYWATRPRYEDKTTQEEEAEQWKQVQKAYHDWAAKDGGTVVDEAPPPPYMLEDEQHTQNPQASAALNVRPVPPEGTKPTLGRSSSASASSASPPPVPARSPSLTMSTPSGSSRPPAINMSSRPPPAPMSTKPVYPPEKVEVVVMRPHQLYQRPSSSHSIVRPSSRVSSPLPAPGSSTVAYLADDFARQTLSHSASEIVPGPQQSHASGISSSVMQMPSVEASLRRPSTSPAISPHPPASPVPVASWPYPGQQQLHYAPYNPSYQPPVPPLNSRPSSSPQGKPSAIGRPGYDWYDANMHPYGPARPEPYYPNTSPNSGTPQGPYIAMDKPEYPYPTSPVPNPLTQDYFQHQIPPAQHHPGGSNSPRPYPPPEWGIQSSPPPLAHRPPTHPQSQSYYAQNQSVPMWTGNGGGGGFNLAGRALDTVEGIAGRDARRHLETLAQSGSKLLNKFK